MVNQLVIMYNKIIVYRIENKEGLGPYRNKNKWLCNVVKNSTDINLRPMYRGFLKDKLQCNYNEIVYGFSSLDHLNNWFDKSTITLLEDYDFSINTYEVPNELCECSEDGQVIFRKLDTNSIKK